MERDNKKAEQDQIKNLAKNWKNVHYLGYQNKGNTISLIRGSDILLQPSLKEGISSTILESMACNTVVIASNVGGNTELIENSINGIIKDPKDSDSFVEQIMILLENTELRKSLENQALKTVEKYDWNQVGNLYLNIYESVLDKSK